MSNICCKKSLAYGIIFLFIGFSFMSITSSLTIEKKVFQELLSFAYSMEEYPGISLINIKVAGEKGLNDWYVSDVGVNFTYEYDDIESIYYGIDGDWKLYTETFYMNEDGEDIPLEWQAVNHEGNYSDVDGPFLCDIDKKDPIIDLTYEIISTSPPWLFLFTANATDATSGMERVEFYMNGELQKTVYGPGPEYEWEVFLDPGPDISIKAMAYDKAGNSEWDSIRSPPGKLVDLEPAKFNFYNAEDSNINSCLDDIFSSEIIERKSRRNKCKPTFENLEGGNFNPAYVIVVFNRKMGNNGWIVSNISIPILYESDRIDEVYYQLNERGWNLYTEPLNFSEDGIFVFSWYVIDSEGYSSIPESISFKIDRTPPEINLIKKRLEINKVQIIANVYDETSNIHRVEFNIDSSYYVEFTDYDFPYEWICSGIFNKKVTVSVYDKAGNSNSSSINTWKDESYYYSNSLVLRFLDQFSNTFFWRTL